MSSLVPSGLRGKDRYFEFNRNISCHGQRLLPRLLIPSFSV
jgi:hypothetical protein